MTDWIAATRESTERYADEPLAQGAWLTAALATKHSSVSAFLRYVEDLEQRVAALEAAAKTPAAPASTATLNQSYTWKPDDAWSAYTAATDGPAYIHSPGFAQDEE